MSQTNVQVPIEQRNHDEEVVKKRELLEGDARFKPANPQVGPSWLASDDRPAALALHHVNLSGRTEAAVEASDLLYGERMGSRKQHMSGRRHAGSHLNQGLNVGSQHLQMPAEPHHEQRVKAVPGEGQVVLPKDQ